MKPGDRIEWTYTRGGRLVDADEVLWSTPMRKWVPIGSGIIHTLISINDEQIAWMNESGEFSARTDDTSSYVSHFRRRPVTPRVTTE